MLAASRLAYCGGYDLDDIDVLAEAANVAEINSYDMVSAAIDGRRDAAIDEAGRMLLHAGATHLPAVLVGHTVHSGDDPLASARRARAGC